MSRTTLGVGLVLVVLTFFAGIGMGLLYLVPGKNAAQDDAVNLDEQGRLLLARLNSKVESSPTPQLPQQSGPPQAQVKPAVAVIKPKLPETPPAFQQAAPPGPVDALNQQGINAAIDKGVNYLKSHQNLNATWGAGGAHAVGYTALPGLTLLECGVSPKDPVVQKAATFVRNNVPKLNATYELSLAILFLDRLGETRDEGLIRVMAMRLIAGQTAAGGWDYHVPILKPGDSDQLFALLEKNHPRFGDPLSGGRASSDPLAKGADFKAQDPLAMAKDATRGISNPPARSGQADNAARKGAISQTGLATIQPLDLDGGKPAKPQAGKESEAPRPAAKETPPKSSAKAQPKSAATRPLPAHLQGIPDVANLGKGKGKAALKPGRDDNSNSQFALLALWTARRHGVPADASLLLAYQRYAASQRPAGGWDYMINRNGQTPSMTCVGLLGLALGHGSAPEVPSDKPGKVMGKTTNEDPAIQNGLKALGGYIGTPAPAGVKPRMESLYFLWSVERVAVLYNLQTIGGKDWYAWGARILVPNQHDDGSWLGGHYPGSAPTIDSCFALLFLKRSNLIKDLSDSLQLMLAIEDPDGMRK
jgi:hypothetical protein